MLISESYIVSTSWGDIHCTYVESSIPFVYTLWAASHKGRMLMYPCRFAETRLFLHYLAGKISGGGAFPIDVPAGEVS